MRKIILTRKTAPAILGMLKKEAHRNQSVIFPMIGTKQKGSKFGKIRRTANLDPMRQTTYKIEMSVTDKGISIINPLNEGHGHSKLIIPFGEITLAYNSYFWRDKWGIWRQMRFSMEYGWALKLTNGRKEVYLPGQEDLITNPRYAPIDDAENISRIDKRKK